MASGRFRELDGLRGLAATCVVLHHITGGFDSKYPELPESPIDVAWGSFGVQLFFLISGYVILMSARRAKRPSDFVISRVSRLYPVYWLALVVSILIAELIHAHWVPSSWFDRLLNVTMMQRWMLIPNVDEVYWTLALEMQFYIFILLLLYVTKCRLSDRVVLAASLTWMVVALCTSVAIGGHSRGLNPQHVASPYKEVLNLGLVEWAPLFCAGMFAFIARTQDRRYAVLAVISGMLAVVQGLLLHDPAYAIADAVVVGIFLGVCSLRVCKPLLAAPIQWLGKVSYSLYVGHLMVSMAVMHTLITHGVNRWVAMGCAIVASLLMATVLHAVGEERGSRWLRDALFRWRGDVRPKDVEPAASGFAGSPPKA